MLKVFDTRWHLVYRGSTVETNITLHLYIFQWAHIIFLYKRWCRWNFHHIHSSLCVFVFSSRRSRFSRAARARQGVQPKTVRKICNISPRAGSVQPDSRMRAMLFSAIYHTRISGWWLVVRSDGIFTRTFQFYLYYYIPSHVFLALEEYNRVRVRARV